MIVDQSCPILCDPMDCSPPGSSVHRILQARILEWVAISFSRGCSQPRDQTQVSALQADSLLSEPLWKSLSSLRSLISHVSLCFVWHINDPLCSYTGRPVCSSPWGSGPTSHKQGDIRGEARGGDGSLCPEGNTTGQMLPLGQDATPLGDTLALANLVFSDSQQADRQDTEGACGGRGSSE